MPTTSYRAMDGSDPKIIILRHAEKFNDGGLCPNGERRAQLLAAKYVGYGAKVSLFANGEEPAAFYANSPHSAETIKPAVLTWPKFSQIENAIHFDQCDINTWSRKAAKEVLTNYDDKIVVMAWEHNRIANAELDQKNLHDPLTLYKLLGLFNYDRPVAMRPAKPPIHLENWCGSNYDYFWIVEYDPTVKYVEGVPPKPKNITVQLQDFDLHNQPLVPKNAWGSQPPHGVFKSQGGQCDPTPKPVCP